MGSKLRTFENGVSIPFCVAKGDILLSNSISLAQKEFLAILKSIYSQGTEDDES